MTQAMHAPFHPSDMPASAVAHAANGVALRWTPGPDELRLPFEDDPVPQNMSQIRLILDLFDSLERYWGGRPDVLVGSDQFIHWDPTYDGRTNKKNPPPAPDLYVVLGVANRNRRSYVVWEEGKPPDFVLEVVSPSSRSRDGKEKPIIYAKMGVPEYFRYDPEGKLSPALAGFELHGCEYRPLPEEKIKDGVVGVRSKKLGLCLCKRPPGPEQLDDSLCWYDPATGKFLPTRHELDNDKRQAEARAAKSDARAAKADQRAAASDARAAKADQRAAASDARAAKAEARAAELEAKAAELAAQVESMRHGQP